MKREQMLAIDRQLCRALVALDRADTQEATSAVLAAGCALDPGAFEENPSGMAAINRYVVERADALSGPKQTKATHE